MKKIISNPFECGYCNIEENYRDDKCKHPKNKSVIICKGDKFPKNCPLETSNRIEHGIPFKCPECGEMIQYGLSEEAIKLFVDSILFKHKK